MGKRNVSLAAFLAVLGVFCEISFGADPNITLEWVSGTAQGEWVVIPSDPSVKDTVVLKGPSVTYENQCRAMNAMETLPSVFVNNSQKIISLQFTSSYPGNCLAIYDPVYANVALTVGPLEDGIWRLERSCAWPMVYEATEFYVGPYSGGDGSAENPWRISCKEDLLEMGQRVEDYNDCFVMAADVNLAGDIYANSLIAKDIPSPAVYYDGISFKGVFDGNDHKISGLKLDGSVTFLALFGCVENGQINNLDLKDCSVSGGYYTAGLVAYNKNSVISNCYSSGQISGDSHVGGLVGKFEFGVITECYTHGSVTGNSRIGGLVGLALSAPLASGTISDCGSSATVVGVTGAGGLIGSTDGGTFIRNYATGNVSGTIAVGGLIGCLAGGNLQNSYAIGNVNGDSQVGGLAGHGDDISNCYSIGDVSGNEYVGGLIGYCSREEISNCFWNAETQTHGVTEAVGETDDYVTVTNVVGLSTSQMQQKATYTTLPAEWDFVDVWGIGEGQSYPYLRRYSVSDIDQDGRVDYRDLAKLAENWMSIDN